MQQLIDPESRRDMIMINDGRRRCESVIILSSDIAESADYIQRIAKQKPNKQSILSQLQKKEQYKDLALSWLRKEIDIYLSTGKLPKQWVLVC